jgi:hypothetical protein
MNKKRLKLVAFRVKEQDAKAVQNLVKKFLESKKYKFYKKRDEKTSTVSDLRAK